MSISTRIHSAARSVAYWTNLALLEVFGPAEQSGDADPIRNLKRKYGRPIEPSWRQRH